MDAVTLALMQYSASSGGGTTQKTVTGNAPITLSDASAKPIVSLTQTGLCTQDGTPTPDAPVDIVCNNGVLTKPHDTYTAVDGQGTYVTPGSAVNRIYKAFDVGDGNYTISVPTAYDFIVQYKTPTDGSTPTDYGNITSWFNGYTTVTLDKGAAYGYGIALRDHVNQYGNISPSDFSGTIVVVHDDEPVEPVGTPEVLTVGWTNLLNPATNITGEYINAGGVITSSDDAQYTDLIPVTAGATYTWSLVSNRPKGGNNRWHGYNSAGNWVQQIKSGNPGHGIGLSFSLTSTIPNGISYVRLSYGIDDTEAMFEEGSTETDYQPYVEPQTASVPMLLSVGDYEDEAEIISGHVTRRCAACIYDGTQPVGENYISTTGGKDVGAIIVYTLESPVTETVTPQPLNTTEGTNTVSVTAEVSPVALEAVYKSGSGSGSSSTWLLQCLLRTSQRKGRP